MTDREWIEITQETLDDPNVDPEDPCGCIIHNAIIRHLQDQGENLLDCEVEVGFFIVDIGEERNIQLSDGLYNLQIEAMDGKRQVPATMVWDKSNRVIYLEGEEYGT